MKLCLRILVILFILGSCKPKTSENGLNKSLRPDSTAPVRAVLLADLPDSLRPVPVPFTGDPVPIDIKIIPGIAGQSDNSGNNNTSPQSAITTQTGYTGKVHLSSFSNENGLAGAHILSMCTDHFGNIWMGTSGNGVSVYDGKTFKTLDVTHGLPNNLIACIIEDSKQNIWLCHGDGGGICRYDGSQFYTFTKKDGLICNDIQAIAEDRAGNMWFGGREGVSFFDGKKFRNYTEKDSLLKNNILSILPDKQGNIWFGHNGGVSRYDGKKFIKHTDFKACMDVHDICQDHSGNLWFATFHGGLKRLNAEGLKHPCLNRLCKHNFADSNELKTHQKEISNLIDIFDMSTVLPGNEITRLHVDASNNIWFKVQHQGVCRYNPELRNLHCESGKCNHNLLNTEDLELHKKEISRAFTSYTSDNGFDKDFLPITNSIISDKSGNIWFGSRGMGVIRYEGEAFTSFTKDQGMLSNTTVSISEDGSGNIWFGSNRGFSIFDGQKIQNLVKDNGADYGRLNKLLQSKTGEKWCLGTWSLLRHDNNKLHNYVGENGFPHNWGLTNLVQDKFGTLWIGTFDGGIIRFDGKSFTAYRKSNGLVSNDAVNLCLDKEGFLWFGSYQHGLNCFDGKSFINLNTEHGLSSNVILSIFCDHEGNIWVCTENGLNLLTAEKCKEIRKNIYSSANHEAQVENIFITFTKSDGLPDLIINSMLEYKPGILYLGTSTGICEFKKDGNKWRTYRVFTARNGYPVADIGVGADAMIKDSRGDIWVSASLRSSGTVRLKPELLVNRKEVPEIILKRLDVNESNLCWYVLWSEKKRKDSLARQLHAKMQSTQEIIFYDRNLTPQERDSIRKQFAGISFDSITKFYQLPTNLVLPYNLNSLGFHFDVIETGLGPKAEFQYFLDGYSKGWSPVTTETKAVFGNISDGRHTLKIRARYENGMWSNPLTYSFTVLPPFYRTWWAYSLYLIFMTGGIYLFVKWRSKKLRQENLKLEQKVKIRTAEVVAEKKEVEKQKQRSEELLLNILPEEVAEELKEKGYADARQFEEVTVLFTDFKNFTQISEKMSPTELVNELNIFFKAFDEIITRLDIEKIKTIGDSYMCVGGLPTPLTDHAERVVQAGLEIQQFVKQHTGEQEKNGQPVLQIRVGIHSGPVVAGIVGIKKYAYDIWGDTVNTASRMESSGEAGKVNISETTYELVKEKFHCIPRGKIMAKHKGEMEMYFVEGKIYNHIH